MMKRSRILLNLMTLGLSAGLAACADSGSSAVADSVPATISLSQSSTAALGAAILGVSPGDDSVNFGGRRIRRALIDSLIVVVTRVDVLPDSEIRRCHDIEGDSAHGFHPGPAHDSTEDHPGDMMGPRHECGRHHDLEVEHEHPPRPDSLVPPDTGWGSRADHWYSLTVVGSGKLNLLALPTDTTTGLTLATGTLPVGEYGAARLIVSSAKIYFDTVITTSNGFTFQPNTAYDVKLPTRDSVMGIMSNAGFTLSTAGADVVLTFDPNTTIGGAAVDAAGNIVIRPVLKPHRGRHQG